MIGRSKYFSRFDSYYQELRVCEELIYANKYLVKSMGGLTHHDSFIGLETYNKYLKILGKCRQFSRAEQVFKTIEKSADSFTISTMISNYGKQGKAHLAVQLFNSLENRRIEIDIVVINALLTVYRNTANYVEFHKLCNRISSYGLHPETVTITLLIDCLTLQKRYKEAEQTFFNFIKSDMPPNKVTFNKAMKLYIEKGEYFNKQGDYTKEKIEYTKAIGIFNKFSKFNIMPDSFSYQLIVNIYCKLHNFKELHTTFEELEKSKLRICHPIFHSMLTLYKNKKEYALAISLFKRMPKYGAEYDELAYVIMIELYEQKGDFKAAKELRNTMIGIENTIDINDTINKLLDEGKIQEAEEIFYKQLNQDINLLSSDSINSILTVYRTNEAFNKAERTFTKIKDKAKGKINTKTCDTIMEIYLLNGKFNKCEDLYKYMQNAEIVTSSFCLSLVMNALDNLDQTSKAREIYKNAASLKGKDKAALTGFMLQILVKNGEFTEAEVLFNNLKNLKSLTTFNVICALKLYIETREYEKAEKLFAELELRFEITPDITIICEMMKIYRAQGKFNESEKLFHSINKRKLTKNDAAINELLACYRDQEKYTEAENLFRRVEDYHISHSSYIMSTMLSVYKRQGKFEKAEELFNNFSAYNVEYESSNVGIMLNVYAAQGKYTDAYKLYHDFTDDKKDIRIILSMLKIVLANFTIEDLTFAESLLKHLREFLKPAHDKSFFYNRDVSNVFQIHHEFTNKVERLIKKRIKIKAINLELKSQLASLGKKYKTKTRKLARLFQTVGDDATLTLREATLLSTYLPNLEFTPPHKVLTESEILKIQKTAYKNLNYPLKPLDKKPKHTVEIINRRGIKLSEYKINFSIYDMVTAGQLGLYKILRLENGSSNLPLFTNYGDKENTETYRNDVFGGSKLKSKISDASYGDLMAITLRASEFYKKWFTYDESFWYAQRAFLPEDADITALGLSGSFTITVMPDSLKYEVVQPFIVQDGCGYIRQSLATQLGINFSSATDEKTQYKTSYTTYQALQCYDYNREAVEEIVKINSETVLKLKRSLNRSKIKLDDNMDTMYSAFSGGLPKIMTTALPVSNDNIVLPNLAHWQNQITDGILFGRNPYDTKKFLVKPREEIELSDELNKIGAIQYTLTGYTRIDSDIIGKSAKGIVAVIPDAQWPEEYASSDLIISAKDFKLSQDWLSKDDKTQAQNPDHPITIKLNGAFISKEVIKPGYLVGLNLKDADKLAADFDGDQIEITAINYGLHATAKMVNEGNAESIPNPKITKTFTPRVNVSNAKKIAELRLPLLEKWMTILNVLCSLSLLQRKEVAEKLVEDHLLESHLGPEWKTQLGIPSNKVDALAIITAEIQIGIKCGEDAPKTKVPLEPSLDRARDYERQLRITTQRNELSVPYSKGLKKFFAKSQQDQLTLKEISKRLTEVLDLPKGNNVIAKSQRALIRLFLGKGDALSDDEQAELEDLSVEAEFDFEEPNTLETHASGSKFNLKKIIAGVAIGLIAFHSLYRFVNQEKSSAKSDKLDNYGKFFQMSESSNFTCAVPNHLMNFQT